MPKPELLPLSLIQDMRIHQYENYLPNAFDESLTILEKVNKMIQRLNELGKLTNDMINKWNEVIEWILNDGLNDLVLGVLEDWYKDGRFVDLVMQILAELKEQGVSITSYGAVANNGSDSSKAIQDAVNSGLPVFIPNGVFTLSKGIALPSNTIIKGAGVGNAVLKFLPNVPVEENLMYNENIAGGNTNIYLEGFTIDGNAVKRFGSTITGAGGTRGSGLTFRGVKNGGITRIHSTDNVLHGIDITCAGIDYPYLGDGNTPPLPSEHIVINNCEVDKFGDDGITTHHSQYLTITNSYGHNPRVTGNQNGIEIDDGSRHIMLANNRSKGCYAGLEIKAHHNASAPYNVVVNGHISINDVRSFNFRHIGHHSATDPISLTARNIVASNLTSVNPNNERGFQGDITPRAMAISGYNGIAVNGFSAYTDDSSLLNDSVITIQFNARNINLSNIVMNGFKNTENGIYVIGGGRRADNVNITNVSLNNSGRNGIFIGGDTNNINVSNVNAIGTEVINPKHVLHSVNSNPQLTGISGVDYPSVMSVAGVDYTVGLTLFNGGFRASSTSTGTISETGAVISSTSSSDSSGNKSVVLSSSSSMATGERSAVISTSTGQATGNYSVVAGSLDCRATANNNYVLGSSASDASGNRSSVLSSFGVLSKGSYKVNGGYGAPDSNNRGLSSNIKWELDSLNGNIKASGAITGSSSWSDFGEYFESLNAEKIPTGTLVTLDNGKIRKAQKDEKIIGVISETAGVVLGEATNHWNNRYLKNEFGGAVYEMKTVHENIMDDEGNLIETISNTVKAEKENPDYIESENYLSRSERDEWHIVGLVGQVFVKCDETVIVGEGINSNNGVATIGNEFIVMEITKKFDDKKGYGVAKILIK